MSVTRGPMPKKIFSTVRYFSLPLGISRFFFLFAFFFFLFAPSCLSGKTIYVQQKIFNGPKSISNALRPTNALNGVHYCKAAAQ